MVVGQAGIFRHILRERAAAALPHEVLTAGAQAAVHRGLHGTVRKVARVIEQFAVRLDVRLAAGAVVEHLLRPHSVFCLAGVVHEVLRQLEDRPCAAGDLAASPCVAARHALARKVGVARILATQIPGGEQHEAQIAFAIHKQVFGRPVSAGGVGVVRGDLVIRDLHHIQIFLVSRHLVRPCGAGKAVYMAVGMARANLEIVVQHFVPHVIVVPHGGVCLVFLIAEQLIRAIEIFRQCVPFDLTFHACILQAIAVDGAVQIDHGLIHKAGDGVRHTRAAHEFIEIQQAAERLVKVIGSLMQQLRVFQCQRIVVFKERDGLGFQPVIARCAVKLCIGAENLAHGAAPSGQALIGRGDASFLQGGFQNIAV